MRRVLVTGGAGFIGSNLVRALVRSGHQVRVLDNSFRERAANLEEVTRSTELIQGDVRVIEDVRRAVQGMDTIFHLAYINGTEFFYKFPGLVLDIAVRGQLNAIDAAEEAGVKTFVYFSSSEVYQTPPVVPTPEDVPLSVPLVANPRYSYGGGKIISELLLLHYAKQSGMRRIIIRPHNVYGPAMGFEHVIPQIVEKIALASHGFTLSEATITIKGNGSETRAFCYIDDAVDGFLLCAERGNDGDIFHVGKDEEISISELIRKIGEILNIKLIIRPGPAASGATSRRCPDISKLRELGYTPRVSLKEGLKETVSWYRDHFVKHPPELRGSQ